VRAGTRENVPSSHRIDKLTSSASPVCRARESPAVHQVVICGALFPSESYGNLPGAPNPILEELVHAKKELGQHPEEHKEGG
jgi:hypothetical protein